MTDFQYRVRNRQGNVSKGIIKANSEEEATAMLAQHGLVPIELRDTKETSIFSKELTVKNVKKYSTLHPRCGTNFIMIVFVVSILIFSFIPTNGFLYRFGMRLLLLPLIAGLSYEFLRFAGKYFENPLVKIIIFPGLMLQRITTRKPDDSMIEVAIKALKSAIA